MKANKHWVEAAPFRAHLLFLMRTSGLSADHIAAVIGVPPLALEQLLRGRHGARAGRVSPEVARKLLGLTPRELTSLPIRLMPAHRARGCLTRLRRPGVDLVDVAMASGSSLDDLRTLESGAAFCSVWLTIQLVVSVRHLSATRVLDRSGLRDAA